MYLSKLASIQLVNWNILEKYNQDPLSVFTKVQLDPSLMYQPGARYPLDKIADLWEEIGRRIKDPCFGLTAATCWHPSNFGTLGYALLMSTCLRTTLERLIRFHRIISDASFGRLDEDSDARTLVFNLTNMDEKKYSPPREDAAIAWIISVLHVNFQRPLSPVSVSFTHGRPECAGKYYELFQSPIIFDAPRCGFVLSLDDADRILPSGNKDMAEFNDHVMTQYLATKDSDPLALRVKKIIVEHLPSGDATVERAASELFCSTRKLQRLLHEEGTSFMALLNDTRRDIAKQYVRDQEMDLTEIAFLLGFSEQSTFSRSFKRWTGESPSSFRKAV
ncbi:MAG: AraC-like DNA-binding protein [Desulforhopalus sp.]|jgi:AraC-like DNA-binding protein